VDLQIKFARPFLLYKRDKCIREGLMFSSVGISLKELGVRGWGKVEGHPSGVQGQSPGGGLGALPPEAQKT